MIGLEGTPAVTAATITFALLLLGMACAFVRMVRGPSLADRVVGLDMLAVLMVAFAGVFAVAADEPAFLDVAIALALVGFLGTVAFARYAKRRAGNETDHGKQEQQASCPNT